MQDDTRQTMRQQPNFKHYTRGGQISFHNLRMWDQVSKTLVNICFFLWVGLTGLLTWYFTSADMLVQTLSYHTARILNWLGQKHTFEIPYHGQVLKHSALLVAHHTFYARTAAYCLHSFYKAVCVGFFGAVTLCMLLAIYFVRKGKQQTDNQFIRGASLVTPETLKKQIIKQG